ncbi:MAG: hypothetical protein ACP5N9_02565 [Candidatus Bilamarchaeum sp.]
MDGELDLALKYPFIDGAKKAIEGLDLNAAIIDLATERIIEGITGGSSPKMVLHEQEKKIRIASFAASRMILGSLKNNGITNRFAVSESKNMRSFLDREDESTVDQIASFFGIHPQTNGSTMTLDLPTYLKYSPRSIDYRIINRRLIRGMIEIKPSEKRRLLEEAIRKHIEKIPLVRDPPQIIIEAGKKILEKMPSAQITIKVNPGDYPPCIMRLLDEAKKHQNLNHQARYYLATYLTKIGLSEDEITKLYSDLPDFNEKITRYQLGHIKNKDYSVPSCSTVMTYGLCCAVCNIGTPLKWHTLSVAKKEEIQKWKKETS